MQSPTLPQPPSVDPHPQTHSAQRLLERCATRRDDADWRELLRHYGARIGRSVQQTLLRAGAAAGPDEVEEMMQEVYCRLLERDGRRLKECRGSGAPQVQAYLCRVAKSAVLDRLRGDAAAKRGHHRMMWVDPARLHELERDPDASPEERAVHNDGYRRLMARCRAAAGASARRNLRILHLCWVEGWTSHEVSEALAEPLAASSIDSLLYRLRRRLREEGPGLVAG